MSSREEREGPRSGYVGMLTKNGGTGRMTSVVKMTRTKHYEMTLTMEHE